LNDRRGLSIGKEMDDVRGTMSADGADVRGTVSADGTGARGAVSADGADVRGAESADGADVEEGMVNMDDSQEFETLAAHLIMLNNQTRSRWHVISSCILMSVIHVTVG
jgi:hypothetical protein